MYNIILSFSIWSLHADMINDTLNFVDRRLFGADESSSFEFGSYDAPSAAAKPTTQPKQRRRKKLNEDTVTPHIRSQKPGGKRIGRPPKSTTEMGPPMGTPMEAGLIKGPKDSKVTNKATKASKNKKVNSGMHSAIYFTT